MQRAGGCCKPVSVRSLNYIPEQTVKAGISGEPRNGDPPLSGLAQDDLCVLEWDSVMNPKRVVPRDKSRPLEGGGIFCFSTLRKGGPLR
ncbi:hypothetical protein SAMN06264849_104128 [Melghirimyces algeriensis]|uniref:Uncharacterized protein n=1 Tax=Melghirimyces algeriensis TaxID=910412 RepID=A0A521CQI9_9BACL|nr:hypothetical protein SAMN06264849_104128 [Melghirimyces algeriensis]